MVPGFCFTQTDNIRIATILLCNIFFDNVRCVAIAGIVQLVGFAYVIVISVVKSWGVAVKDKNKPKQKRPKPLCC
jgi:hypothetical protein